MKPNGSVDVSIITEVKDGLFDLLHLDSAIYQQSQIVEAKADDLNCILESQGIPHEDQLIDETEDVKREEGRDGASGNLGF